MHIVFIILAAVLGVMLPEIAWADGVLNPTKGNTWDLYVFGNGRVIFDTLNSIKMLMVPDAGSSGFQMLLLLMASLGFLVLAVAAGFDPGKNLMRMFTYILVVWGVSWGSTSLTANVNINDMVVNGEGLKETYTVDRVPALVALPAALTSQVGHYFTTVIETYFTIPGPYKLAGENGGQFNLFSKMVEESSQFMFTDSGVKNTMMAYVSDCVVPALARGKFQGKVIDPLTGESRTEYGAAVLSQSANLLEALGSAKHNAIMTKVYRSSYAPTGAAAVSTEDSGFGTIKTCAAAYEDLKTMMTANAEALAGASAKAYAKAGVTTPYETLFSTMLAGASAPGGGGAAYSRPSGYILQQGMLNSMSGSFRQAALQTGNNEMMTAAAIAQAEQNQRSTWVAGFHVFNNMMGYVFTVLQAFIFAITPMVVVALMVPGLGKSIFTNYAQILIWLTLWMPMLALINYIITLFGTESIASTMTMSGGVSMSNKGLLAERTNNLVIAAQFLGTMTPLLTWGLVKGALAFTEFISSGVGSAFASQAGATAASGNMSLNNLSMDNTSMNKFNTAMSSTVGTQGTNAFTNAGAMLSSQDGGGGNALRGGSAVDMKQQVSDSLSQGIQSSQAVSKVMSESMSKSSSLEQAYALALSKSNGEAGEKAAANILQTARSASKGEGAGATLGSAELAQLQKQVSAMEKIGRENAMGVDVGAKAFGTGVGTSHRQTGATGNEVGDSAGTGRTAQDNRAVDIAKYSANQGATATGQATDTKKVTNGRSTDESATSRMSAAESRVLSDAISRQDSITESLSSTRSAVNSFGVAGDLDMQTVNQKMAEMQALQNDMSLSTSQLKAEMDAMGGALTDRSRMTESQWADTRANIEAKKGGLGSTGVTAPPGFEAQQAAARDTMTTLNTEREALATDIKAGVADVRGKVETRQKEDAITNDTTMLNHNFRNSRGEKEAQSSQDALTNPGDWFRSQ